MPRGVLPTACQQLGSTIKPLKRRGRNLTAAGLTQSIVSIPCTFHKLVWSSAQLWEVPRTCFIPTMCFFHVLVLFSCVLWLYKHTSWAVLHQVKPERKHILSSIICQKAFSQTPFDTHYMLVGGQQEGGSFLVAEIGSWCSTWPKTQQQKCDLLEGRQNFLQLVLDGQILIPFANKNWFLQYLHDLYESPSVSDISSCVPRNFPPCVVLWTIPGCGQWACRNKKHSKFFLSCRFNFFHTLSLRITPCGT